MVRLVCLHELKVLDIRVVHYANKFQTNWAQFFAFRVRVQCRNISFKISITIL